MELTFDDAIRVGAPMEMVEIQRDAAARATIRSSRQPRGLAMRSLHVTRSWDGLWSLLGRRQQIYFLSVAFDLSGHEPVVLPPAEVPGDAVHSVKRGEVIQFSLGDGAPIFPPRVIEGGLITYITVCEADKGARHVGEMLAQVHAALRGDDSLLQTISGFVKNPARAVAEEIVKAATAALQPIATILSSGKDDYIGLFSGIFPARGPWKGKLMATSNGTTIELAELR